MALKRLLPVIALLVLAGIASGAAPDGTSEQALNLATVSQPGDVCKNGYTSYYWMLEDRFTGNESFRVFCGPAGCAGCEGGWKPVSVTMYLYWEEENSCALTVQAEIHEADPTDLTRSGQGRLIAASEKRTVGPFKPAGLWAVTVAMPPDTPAINGSCFASIRFLDTCDELPAVVAAPGECDAMVSWNDRGEGWVDLRELDLPGNLCAYATFECQVVEKDASATWSTIKGMFQTNK